MGLNTQEMKISIKTTDATDYQQIGCMTSLGDLDLGKRSSKEDGCMDKEIQGKVIGALKYGNLQVGYKYNPATPAGHATLGTAHETTPAPLMDVRIELPNKPDGGANGTQFDFQVYVTERSISFPVDDDMVASATLEMNGKPTVNAAA